jgi:hypothetical protein
VFVDVGVGVGVAVGVRVAVGVGVAVPVVAGVLDDVVIGVGVADGVGVSDAVAGAGDSWGPPDAVGCGADVDPDCSGDEEFALRDSDRGDASVDAIGDSVIAFVLDGCASADCAASPGTTGCIKVSAGADPAALFDTSPPDAPDAEDEDCSGRCSR